MTSVKVGYLRSDSADRMADVLEVVHPSVVPTERVSRARITQGFFATHIGSSTTQLHYMKVLLQQITVTESYLFK